MRRQSCGACGGTDLHLFLDLGLSPIADAYTHSRDEPSARYPLQLAVCTDCWLVQLLEVVDAKTLFGTGYSFYSSASAPLSEYHQDYATAVLRYVGDRGGVGSSPLVVEVGCNDGDMLRHFAREGWRTVGVDPAEGPAALARERTGGLILNQPFTEELGRELRGTHGPADVVIANHVLAHVEDVSSVLAGIQHLLGNQSTAYIEVQYLPDMLLGNAFDLVYHEHRNFFSLSSLESAAARHGLHVDRVWTTPRQGGSLRVELVRDTAALGVSTGVHRLLVSEGWLNGTCTYKGLQGRAERLRTRLLELLDRAGEHVVGYGAPAKATTLLNFCGITNRQIKFITDTTAAKQNRFVPGTGIQVVPPAVAAHSRVDTYLLLAWNYSAEIMARERQFTADGGRWIIPAPVPTYH